MSSHPPSFEVKPGQAPLNIRSPQLLNIRSPNCLTYGPQTAEHTVRKDQTPQRQATCYCIAQLDINSAANVLDKVRVDPDFEMDAVGGG